MEFVSNSPVQHDKMKAGVQCVDGPSLGGIPKTFGLNKDEQENGSIELKQASVSEAVVDLVVEKKHSLECSRDVCSECKLAAQEEGKSDFLAENLGSLTQQEWQPYESYLSRTRINVNVRQVHKPSETVGSLKGQS